MVSTVSRLNPVSRSSAFDLFVSSRLRDLSPAEIAALREAREHFPKSTPWLERAAAFVAAILSTEE